uniref:Uncharacterized protein n=2 Tax=Oryza brachyantha TaxID=4533 RepID=J3KZJ3_ORYBR
MTNVDNVIINTSISMEEKKEHVNGAKELNHSDEMITIVMEKTDGDKKIMVEEPTEIAISRTASSNRCQKQAKKRGVFGLFQALFMSFSSSTTTKKMDVTTAMGDKKKFDMIGVNNGDKEAMDIVARSSSDVTSWKNLVDGMRPLRLYGQLEYYPPPSPDRTEGVTSRYSSTEDLRELGNYSHEKEEEVEEDSPTTEDGGYSSNAIDRQAEEFIAKFYEQFRLQKSDSLNNWAD